MLKSKKGSEFWPPYTVIPWILFGIGLGFLVVFVAFIVLEIGSEQIKIKENLESFSLMQRLLESPDCFIYDIDDIVLNNVIDVNKFTEERLDKCYFINNYKLPAFRLMLSSESAKLNKIIKTKNWDSNRDSEETKNPRSILVYSGNKLHNGELTLEIQNLQ